MAERVRGRDGPAEGDDRREETAETGRRAKKQPRRVAQSSVVLQGKTSGTRRGRRGKGRDRSSKLLKRARRWRLPPINEELRRKTLMTSVARARGIKLQSRGFFRQVRAPSFSMMSTDRSRAIRCSGHRQVARNVKPQLACRFRDLLSLQVFCQCRDDLQADKAFRECKGPPEPHRRRCDARLMSRSETAEKARKSRSLSD